MDPEEKTEKFYYRHPWEISRRQKLLSLLDTSDNGVQYADIGAGDMYFIDQLKKFSRKPIYAIDRNFTFTTNNENTIMFQNIYDLPRYSIDLILLLDVLEHIENDFCFVKELLTVLKPDGKILITVPAFQFFFSPHDIYLKHLRRYTLKQLNSLLVRNGLELVEGFYFFTSLFIVRMIEVILYKLGIKKKFGKTVSEWRYNEHHFISRIIIRLLNADFTVNRILIKLSIYFPGLSACVLCKRKSV